VLIVLTTTSTTDEAESLANGLVQSRLAACVQILPKMTSVYAWEGKITKDEENLLLIKTLPQKYEAVEKYILDHHSYDTPEIVAVDADKASAGYLKWLTDYL
jgi:periplasmic divalent cation tolerance protein